MDKKILLNKIVLITGGAQGIGSFIAKRFLEEGASVVIADIDEGKFNSNFKNVAGDLLFIQADLTLPEDIDKVYTSIYSNFRKLNILINNAAILDATSYNNLTMSHFNYVINNNMNSVLSVTLKFINILKSKADNNKILNISSIMGVRGSKDSIPYSTAKGGVVNLTRCLAVDLGKFNINVNTICPGFINTRMALLPDGTGHEYETESFKDVYLKHERIPLIRTGEPEDITGPALFLCSKDSDYVTGQMLLVDGGISSVF
ncbi:MAG: SDR family oxidoreductase [Lentimicrobiaceae bacterium]|jgi:NAD(P)-dependent dehydrogenase (short-subunit alcohol dehydrogenase family)|nr:SDR family oxidoreductase [Lentimicrobiaceae bacterium]